MTYVEVGRKKDFTVEELNNIRFEIQMDPTYQRNGAIWNPERKRLLIDSILQGYDIPKLYFRIFSPMEIIDGVKYRFAVIDGRQRIETILEFLDDEFSLGSETEAPHGSNSVNLNGMKFSRLFDEEPVLARRFLKFPLDLVTVETDDLDVIDDMFLRLNEATPLNAAEKRNAFPGPVPSSARELSTHKFFVDCLPFNNSRYRHYDMATKFLYFEQRRGVADTKKTYLDRFVRNASSLGGDIIRAEQCVRQLLDRMTDLFIDRDYLLQSVGMSSVYYLVIRQAMLDGWDHEITRQNFVQFEEARALNRSRTRGSDNAGEYQFNEFDRFSQSPNDAIALRFRRDVILEFLEHPLEQIGEEPMA
ncbi:hypothetical protein D3C74_125180 [compost metagenome]